MFQRLVNSSIAFGLTVATYLAYAYTLAPLIEPGLNRPLRVAKGHRPIPARTDRAAVRQANLPWFTTGDWELDPNNKMLETPDGVLLFRQYQNKPDGTVQIQPCTMIFFPRGAHVSEAQRTAQATLLQAPQGAVLKLDSPLDLKTGRMGKIVGGKLVGEVNIFSQNRLPGPEDDLHIRTSEIELSNARLVTDDMVHFRLGPHAGRGRRLRIDLEQKENAKGMDGLSGVKSLELLEEVWMRMLAGADLLQTSAPTAPAATSARQPTPLEITCGGRFRFDLQDASATFNDLVHVTRINPVGPSDQLDCAQLTLFFRPKAGKPAASKSMQLEFDHLAAHGFPVVVRSPLRDLEARGDLLEWDDATRTLRLSATSPLNNGNEPVRQAHLRQASNQLWAVEVQCQMDAAGQISAGHALGPGKLYAREVRDPAKPESLQVQWLKQLQFGPQENLQHLSILGQAVVVVNDTERLAAEEIHAWLMSDPLAPRKQNKHPLGSFQPQKMAARGSVDIVSEALIGQLEELHLWFEHRPPAIVPLPSGPERPPLPGSVQPLPTTAMPVAFGAPRRPNEPPAKETRRFDVRAGLLRARVVMDGKRAQVGEAWAERQVQIREFLAENPRQSPLLLRGDTLHVLNDDPSATVVHVTGRPGHVEGQGVVLEGANLHLDRGLNRMWVDGPGRLVLLRVKEASNSPRSAEPGPPLDVAWQKGMNFDGLTAEFQQQVQAVWGTRTLKTEQVLVQLNRRVDFQQTETPRAGQEPEVVEAQCPLDFTLDSRTMEAGQVVSVEHLQARQLKINRSTQEFSAVGPGRLHRTGLEKTGDQASLRLTSARTPNSGQAAEAPKLMALQATFAAGFQGHLERKDVTFSNQVECVYGPVSDFGERLSPENLKKGDIWLRCEALTVRQSPTSRETQVEFEAAENVRVRSGEFSAWGKRMTYSQAKDQLILEGDGRTTAKLWRQLATGASLDAMNAQKIYFWPKHNHFKLEGITGADLNQLSPSQP